MAAAAYHVNHHAALPFTVISILLVIVGVALLIRPEWFQGMRGLGQPLPSPGRHQKAMAWTIGVIFIVGGIGFLADVILTMV